jgi:hypothetical protein
MWQDAKETQQKFKRVATLGRSALLVTRRRYGDLYRIPGHIGIITNAQPLTFIHTDDRRLHVVERPIRSLEFEVGYLEFVPS